MSFFFFTRSVTHKWQTDIPQPVLITLSGRDTEWEGILLPLGRRAEMENFLFG